VRRALATSAAVLALAGLSACKPGVNPSSAGQQVIATLEHDLQLGDSLAQMEADVANDVAMDINNPLLAVLVEDALDTLIEAGQLAPLLLSRAQTAKTQVHPLAAAARAGT